jgi:CheY-like chemotaxis protein
MVPKALTPEDQPALRILVVEDDVVIRASAAQFLRDAGFDVLEAADVDSAVAILWAAADVRVVFIDVTLPGDMSGLDLLEIIQRDFPLVKMLFTSGVAVGDRLAQRGLPFLRKPYFLFEVERQIRALIESP